MSFLTQKLIWTKTETAMMPDETSHGLGKTTNHHAKEKNGHFFPTILGQGAPSFRKFYRQKEVYLNMAYSRRFCVEEPRHLENVIARNRYTLIWCIYNNFGLRSPVIKKPLSPERGIP